jgi:hypothetical protein
MIADQQPADALLREGLHQAAFGPNSPMVWCALSLTHTIPLHLVCLCIDSLSIFIFLCCLCACVNIAYIVRALRLKFALNKNKT